MRTKSYTRPHPDQCVLPLFAVPTDPAPTPRKPRVPFSPPKRTTHPALVPSKGRPSPIITRRGFNPRL